ncbi:MAG: BON domain-containing protein [Pirellulaceae bacterium]|nr:BON domain-containing protein [Pirellulaceae bacterium]
MKHLPFIMLIALATIGCNDLYRSNSNSDSNTVGNSTAVDRNNTAVNARDRDSNAKTPFDQNENQKDIDITANIRKRVVDTKMSIDAQNVKIITQDGRVTLRGPVKSADEKTRIEEIARNVAGDKQVDSQLEVVMNR